MSSFIKNFFGAPKPARRKPKEVTGDATKDPPVGSTKCGDYYFTGIKKSKTEGYKWDGVYWKRGKEKLVHFGKAGEKDFTQHQEKDRKDFYDFKHKDDNLSNLMSSKALEKWILWDKPTVELGVKSYKSKLSKSEK